MKSNLLDVLELQQQWRFLGRRFLEGKSIFCSCSRVWSHKYALRSLNKPIKIKLGCVCTGSDAPAYIDGHNDRALVQWRVILCPRLIGFEVVICSSLPLSKFPSTPPNRRGIITSTRHHFGSSVDIVKAVSRQPLGPSLGPFCGALEKSYLDVSNVHTSINKERTFHARFT